MINICLFFFLHYNVFILSKDSQQQTTNQSTQKDILKDIYNSLSKLIQKIEGQKLGNFDESLLEEFSVLDIEMLQSKADDLFPKPYPFLIQNSRLPQTFIRGQPPSFAAHLYGSSTTIDILCGSQLSSYSNTLLNDDNLQDIKFDIITLNKMSLSSCSTFRRCLRCSNFSRVFKTKPYPFLVYRLNNRCLCGGLFLLYTRSSSSMINNNSSNNTNDTSTTATAR